MSKIPPYKTMQEAGAELRLSESRVWQLVQAGTLNGENIGSARIAWADEKYEALKKERGVK